jgi:hypothetical protein
MPAMKFVSSADKLICDINNIHLLFISGDYYKLQQLLIFATGK